MINSLNVIIYIFHIFKNNNYKYIENNLIEFMYNFCTFQFDLHLQLGRERPINRSSLHPSGPYQDNRFSVPFPSPPALKLKPSYLHRSMKFK